MYAGRAPCSHLQDEEMTERQACDSCVSAVVSTSTYLAVSPSDDAGNVPLSLAQTRSITPILFPHIKTKALAFSNRGTTHPPSDWQAFASVRLI